MTTLSDLAARLQAAETALILAKASRDNLCAPLLLHGDEAHQEWLKEEIAKRFHVFDLAFDNWRLTQEPK